MSAQARRNVRGGSRCMGWGRGRGYGCMAWLHVASAGRMVVGASAGCLIDVRGLLEIRGAERNRQPDNLGHGAQQRFGPLLEGRGRGAVPCVEVDSRQRCPCAHGFDLPSGIIQGVSFGIEGGFGEVLFRLCDCRAPVGHAAGAGMLDHQTRSQMWTKALAFRHDFAGLDAAMQQATVLHSRSSVTACCMLA